MKNFTSQKIAQSIIIALCFVWVALILSSCGTSRAAGSNYQNHLRSKHSGGHHMSTDNKGCGWANN